MEKHSKIVQFILLFFIIFSLKSETINPSLVTALPQGYIFESFSGCGYSNCTLPAVPNISAGNPASMVNFEKAAFGFTYPFDSNINPAVEHYIPEFNYTWGIEHKRITNWLPQSVGFVFPIKRIRLGFGFSQRFNSRVDFGKIEHTLTDETDRMTTDTQVWSYSALAAIPFNHIFSGSDILSIGFQYNLNRFSYNDELFGFGNDVSAYGCSFSAGFQYQCKNTKLQNYRIGIFYEKGVKIKAETPDPDLSLFITTDYVKGVLPDKIHLGVLVQPFGKVRFTGNASYVFWNGVDSNMKNAMVYAVNSLFECNDKLQASVGFLISNRTFDEENNLYDNQSNFNAFYLMAGLMYKLTGHFNIDFSFADSHLFSGDWRQHSIVKLGIVCNFNKTQTNS